MATAGSTCASPLAAYEFVVNGVVQTPLSCPHTSGQFPVPTGQSGAVCDTMTLPADPPPQCAGITSVAIANAGTEPLAYNAEPVWDPSNGGVVPGVQFGNPYELAGVLNPGQQVDITSAYVGGIVAVLGATAPFSDANSGNYIADEGTIPWPAGVFGGGGTMYVTEIEIATACGGNSNVW